MTDITKFLNTMLILASHIGFMENSQTADEYRILELKDELEEMKQEFFEILEERGVKRDG